MPRKTAQDQLAQYPMAPAREDRRPLYFTVPPGREFTCAKCEAMGFHKLWPSAQVVINDPANAHDASGGVYTYCLAHLPDDAVIWNPQTKQFRDKRGKTWSEPDADKPLAAFATQRTVGPGRVS